MARKIITSNKFNTRSIVLSVSRVSLRGKRAAYKINHSINTLYKPSIQGEGLITIDPQTDDNHKRNALLRTLPHLVKTDPAYHDILEDINIKEVFY